MKNYMNEDGTPFSKEQFIEKIKTNKDFSDRFGDLGPIYGKQWRDWEYYCGGGDCNIDQIANLISELRTNPDSRRLMVNAWNVGDLYQMTLPPCHYGFQVYTRELSLEERRQMYNGNLLDEYGETKSHDELTINDLDKLNIPTRAISLMFNMRSTDVPLGLPFNIASYGLLLEIIAKAVNMVPEELIGNLGDCHIYNNQIDGVKEQITRSAYKLPTLKHMKTDAFYKSLSDNPSLYNHLDVKDFVIENYQSHPAIKMPLSN